jgi:hypothetical protein
MTHYTVTRSGKAGHFQLYSGGLRYRAVEAYARATPEPGTVVILSRGREVLRRSDEVVTLACSKCEEPILGDDAPAIDAMSSLPVCSGCTNAQRHSRRAL